MYTLCHMCKYAQWVTSEKGESDGFVELAYLSLHKAIGLVLCCAGEGMDDPLPLADFFERMRLGLPTFRVQAAHSGFTKLPDLDVASVPKW